MHRSAAQPGVIINVWHSNLYFNLLFVSLIPWRSASRWFSYGSSLCQLSTCDEMNSPRWSPTTLAWLLIIPPPCRRIHHQNKQKVIDLKPAVFSNTLGRGGCVPLTWNEKKDRVKFIHNISEFRVLSEIRTSFHSATWVVQEGVLKPRNELAFHYFRFPRLEVNVFFIRRLK